MTCKIFSSSNLLLNSCFYLFIGAYTIGPYYETAWEHLQDIMQKKNKNNILGVIYDYWIPSMVYQFSASITPLSIFATSTWWKHLREDWKTMCFYQITLCVHVTEYQLIYWYLNVFTPSYRQRKNYLVLRQCKYD